MSSAILSTKILTHSQKNLLLNSGISLVEYDAIKIQYLNFEIPDNGFDHLIFTSQNGVRSYLQRIRDAGTIQGQQRQLKSVFCVGEKTKFILEENGLNVVKMGYNAADLAKKVVKSHQNDSFLWISGNRPLPILPEVLQKNNVRYNQLIGYVTKPNFKQFNRQFDGVLFFSPSGVDSFFKSNTAKGAVFCIGETTAFEAKKHVENSIVAKKPTVENVIVQAVNYLNAND